ncbi:MAG TPA: DUF4404 family protein [Gemmataceae bacterium]|nr:DUF4404 family protein [Gemmataceae bacterium]
MPDEREPNAETTQTVQERIRELARLLRHSQSLSPPVQTALAELLDELSGTLRESEAPPAEVTHLAESATHLAQALHEQHDEGLVAKAGERLRLAMLQAEEHAPTAVGLARRVVDALASIGI